MIGGTTVEFALYDEPYRGGEKEPDDPEQPAIEILFAPFLVQFGIEVVGKERTKRDKQQDEPQRRLSLVLSGSLAHFHGRLVKPVQRVNAQGDDHQEHLHGHGTELNTRHHRSHTNTCTRD